MTPVDGPRKVRSARRPREDSPRGPSPSPLQTASLSNSTTAPRRARRSEQRSVRDWPRPLAQGMSPPPPTQRHPTGRRGPRPLHDGRDRLDIVTLTRLAKHDAVRRPAPHHVPHVIAPRSFHLFPGNQVRHRADHREQLLLRVPATPAHIAEADLRRASRRRSHPSWPRSGWWNEFELQMEQALTMLSSSQTRYSASSLPLRLDHTFPVEPVHDLRVTTAPRPPATRSPPSASTARAGSSTSAAGRTCPARPRSARRLQLTSSPAPTGAATRRTPCSPASTAPPSPPRRSWTSTSTALEMARQRDHRKLGRELDLFSFHEEGPGFPFFHPKGMRVINALLDYWRAEHVLAGYEETRPRSSCERTLWERSGHWDNYKDNMYFTAHRRRRFRGEAHELPGRHPDLQEPTSTPIAICRCATPNWAGAPPRDVRRAARPLPRADVHPGRRPHLLPARADRRRGAGVIALHAAHVRTFGFDRVHVELSTRPEKSIG